MSNGHAPYRIEVDYDVAKIPGCFPGGMGTSAEADALIGGLAGEKFFSGSGSGFGERNNYFTYDRKEDFERAWRLLSLHPELRLRSYYDTIDGEITHIATKEAEN